MIFVVFNVVFAWKQFLLQTERREKKLSRRFIFCNR